ncbi:MAG: hypothetical protein CMI30_08150 [Opitutae bacterium]|nr:hypothetical protein [Opitutae bacterium]
MSEDSEKKDSGSEDEKETKEPLEDSTGAPLEEALKDPGLETIKKYLPLMLVIVVVVLVAFFFFRWKASSDEEAEWAMGMEFRQASQDQNVTALEAFAVKYPNEVLAGIALYEAADVQYHNGEFSQAAENFSKAIPLLANIETHQSLLGSATLGHGVSLIRSGDFEQGKALLLGAAENMDFLPSVRAKSWYLLGINALSEDDESAYERSASALKADELPVFEDLSKELESRKTQFDRQASATTRDKINFAQKNLRFLAENKVKQDVNSTASGLQYQILTEGNGTKPQLNDRVEVHFHGTLIDGDLFNSSVERGKPEVLAVSSPQLSAGFLLMGLTEGLQLMKTGGKRRFFIPSDLAYGEKGLPPAVEPGAALVIEVELLRILPPPTPPKPAPVPTPVPNDMQPNPGPGTDQNATTPQLQPDKKPSETEGNATKPLPEGKDGK